MQGFQNLNKGTSVSPAEFHKGHLTLDRQIGRKLYENIPAILKRVEASWGATGKTPGRMQESKLLRDCFGLFYQFISGEKTKVFWSVGKIQEDVTKSVEYMLLKYIENWTHERIDKEMKTFERYLFSTRAIIYEVLEKEKQSMGKSFSPALRRWLIHLNIWRKNNNRPVYLYKELVEKLMQTQRDYKSFTSRVLLPSGDFVTLGTDTLGHLHQLCRELDVALYEGRNRRSYPVAQGYDVSHKKPFSQYGEGDTFIEPSSINRARGDRLIE